MGKVTVNGEPVGETTGSMGTRWEDTPGRHAYCDSEIRRQRERADSAEAALTDLGRRLGTVITHQAAAGREKLDRAEAKLEAVRDQAELWAGRAPAERTLAEEFASYSPHDAVSSDCGREILAIIGRPSLAELGERSGGNREVHARLLREYGYPEGDCGGTGGRS